MAGHGDDTDSEAVAQLVRPDRRALLIEDGDQVWGRAEGVFCAVGVKEGGVDEFVLLGDGRGQNVSCGW